MEYILELVSLGLYFWLGQKIFGDRFREDRRQIPLWSRAILGLSCFTIIGGLALGTWFLLS